MANTIYVTPSSFEMGSMETFALSFDVSGDMADGETIQSATASLINRKTGASHPEMLIDVPDIDTVNSIITQIVSGLVEGKYTLIISFVVEAGVKEPAAVLHIDCPL